MIANALILVLGLAFVASIALAVFVVTGVWRIFWATVALAALIVAIILLWPGGLVNRYWFPPTGTDGGAPIATPAAPAATQAPAAPAFTQQWEVPDGRWTPALTENLVIENAVQVRPTKPWEGTVGPVEGQVYQFKSDYIDTDATTWQPGVHLYEFDLATGWQPVFVGIQGDSPVQLCWMQEKGAQGAQLLMKTMKGNGTSALVFFTKTDKVPANTCP